MAKRPEVPPLSAVVAELMRSLYYNGKMQDDSRVPYLKFRYQEPDGEHDIEVTINYAKESSNG